MDHKLAIIALRADDVGAAGAMRPLMLHTMLFCPIIRWVCQELSSCGVGRFFVVCDEQWRGEAESALSDMDGVTFFSALDEAVSSAEGDVVVVPRPVIPIIGGGESAVFQASAADVLAWAEKGFAEVPEGAEAVYPAGDVVASFLPLGDASLLPEIMPRCRELIVRRMVRQGVTVMDMANTYVDPRCTVAPEAVLLPGTILRGCTTIGKGCEIGPNAMIRDCTVGEYTTVNASQVNESAIGSHATVGPFAYVRPGCTVGDGCRIGDFVELKNSHLDEGTKVSHLTYVGDSDVGKRVNFGCGTVTTNYNGLHKYRCTVGDDVFLGCNTNLIAPVTVGDGAYTAAGSTVDKDVPAGALAIARVRQENKIGWAARFFKKKK